MPSRPSLRVPGVTIRDTGRDMTAEPEWVTREREEYAATEWWKTVDPVLADHVPGPPMTNGNGAAPDIDHLSPRQELDAVLMRGRTILDIDPPEALIEGWLNLDSFAVLYGRPKSGKSFVALDMALSIATGTPWHGCKVTPGPVLYVVAEGVRGVGPRVDAWSELNGVDVPDDLWWLPRPVNLLSAPWSFALAELAAELQPRYVVIDTLNRSMPGGDENSSKDMSTVIDACTRLRMVTSACVKLVHHSGKNQDAGARGHSSLLGAVDTEIELRSTDGLIELTNSAQKDGPEAETLHLGLTPAANSVAVTQRAHRDGAPDISPSAHKLLTVLENIQAPGGISTTVWLRSAEVAERTFYNSRRSLLEGGLISNLGSDRSPRYVVKGSAYDPSAEELADPLAGEPGHLGDLA